MGHDDTALAGLPEAGEPVFYPKVGHCIFRGLTEDRVAPGTQLLELEDLEEGSRILIPLARVPELNLRPAGLALDEIKAVLGAEYEEPIEDEDERHSTIDALITEGSPAALAQSLKRLHLLRQTEGLTREEEQTRKKVRSWLAAEVSISRECTRAEAQAFMTRVLQESMAEHRRKEKEEAKQRRRAARAQKKADEEAAAQPDIPLSAMSVPLEEAAGASSDDEESVGADASSNVEEAADAGTDGEEVTDTDSAASGPKRPEMSDETAGG